MYQFLKKFLKLNKQNNNSCGQEEIKSLISNAFDKLSTQHKQESIFKDHGEFVEPAEIIDELDGSTIGCVIPFEAKLNILLNMPETELLDINQSNLDILKSKNIKSHLNDGIFVKETIAKQKLRQQYRLPMDHTRDSENTLYFALYYDDIEIVNAIGSSRKKHKLGKISL